MQDTFRKIAQDCRTPGQTIAAFLYNYESFLFIIFPFSAMALHRVTELLNTFKSEKSKIEYLFVARRRILKFIERGPSPIRVGQRRMQFSFLFSMPLLTSYAVQQVCTSADQTSPKRCDGVKGASVRGLSALRQVRTSQLFSCCIADLVSRIVHEVIEK